MDWKEFKELPQDQQLSTINYSLLKTQNINETAKILFNKSKSTIQSHCTKVLNTVYDKDLKQYVPNGNIPNDNVPNDNVTNGTNIDIPKVKKVVTPEPKKTLLNDKTKNKTVGPEVKNNSDGVVTVEMFDKLMNEFEELKRLVHGNVSVINSNIYDDMIDNFKYINTSIRVDETTIKDFRTFCSSSIDVTFKKMSTQDILSIALLEFMKNHS